MPTTSGANKFLCGGICALRNAIVHGLGYLTRKQVRNDEGAKVLQRLRGAGVPVIDRRVHISSTIVEQVATTCRAFVLWLDAEAAGATATPQPASTQGPS